MPFTRDIVINYNTNELYESNVSNVVSTAYPYTYVENDYIIRIEMVDENLDPVDLSAFTYMDAGVGNIAGTNPLVEATNINSTDIWADCNVSAGKLCFEISFNNASFENDLGSTTLKTYYLQMIGNDAEITNDNYNTIFNIPIYVRNTIWRD